MNLSDLTIIELQVYVAAFAKSAGDFAGDAPETHARHAGDAVDDFRRAHPHTKRRAVPIPAGYVNRTRVLNECVKIVRAVLSPGRERDQIVKGIVAIRAPRRKR